MRQRLLREEPEVVLGEQLAVPVGRNAFAVAADEGELDAARELVGLVRERSVEQVAPVDDEAKVKNWLGKGAQPTEAVSRLLKVKGISA